MLGLSRAVVALTKSDTVEADMLELAAEEVSELLAETSLAGAPVLPVSSLSGDGIEALREALSELARAGCEVSFLSPGASPAGHTLALEAAALLHREGLPREVALRALTLHPAQALGIEEALGSLQAGRRGDLIVLDADPLEPGAETFVVMGAVSHCAGSELSVPELTVPIKYRPRGAEILRRAPRRNPRAGGR